MATQRSPSVSQSRQSPTKNSHSSPNKKDISINKKLVTTKDGQSILSLFGALLFGLVAIAAAVWPKLATTRHSPGAADAQPVWPYLEDEKVSVDHRGLFPEGCTWREIYRKDHEPKFWDIRYYEFYNPSTNSWSMHRPTACVTGIISSPSHASQQQQNQHQKTTGNNNNNNNNNKPRDNNKGPPLTKIACYDLHCTYQNLWINGGHMYALFDHSSSGDRNMPRQGEFMTKNKVLNTLVVKDASIFASSLSRNVKYLNGDTLILNFIHFLHPTAIGHWLEMLGPLFSVLRMQPTSSSSSGGGGGNFNRPPDRVLLLDLKRAHLMQWVRAMLAVTLGLPPKTPLPPLLMQKEVDSVWKQITAPLEGFNDSDWICFQNVLVVKDTFSGGRRTFFSAEDAQLFRRMAYVHANLPPPTPLLPLPKNNTKRPVITFQRKLANRRVVNEAELLEMLGEFGDVQVVEFDAETSFSTQVAAMASTCVFVAVHTSNLANSIFLPPGSAVVELIQRNWVWHNLDESFLVQTTAMGDVHHFAWRSHRHNSETRYLDPADAKRFGTEDWDGLKCDTEECVEAHTNVDVIVNIEELRSLMGNRLPYVYEGRGVEELRLPWPSRE